MKSVKISWKRPTFKYFTTIIKVPPDETVEEVFELLIESIDEERSRESFYYTHEEEGEVELIEEKTV